ncbi:tetratricopeptide repeat protein [Planctomycetota bacterium]|nr:tetratricopeptide repeat protein [Planctomycetota bacterium]QQE12579.1 tetratricopeptide repeat protein [Planctomycetota bacterium]
MRKAHRYIALLLITIIFTGCTGNPKQDKQVYESPAEAKAAQAEKASILNHEAAMYIEQRQYQKAETLLKEALTEDMTYAPAHNNLGLVYYHQQQYYTAAWEFEYAVKLMDNASEPLNNLGMVYEAVGQYEKAHGYYERAYKADPNNVQIIGNYARNHVRQGLRNDQVRTLIDEIILRDNRTDWIEWAKEQRAVMGK